MSQLALVVGIPGKKKILFIQAVFAELIIRVLLLAFSFFILFNWGWSARNIAGSSLTAFKTL